MKVSEQFFVTDNKPLYQLFITLLQCTNAVCMKILISDLYEAECTLAYMAQLARFVWT